MRHNSFISLIGSMAAWGASINPAVSIPTYQNTFTRGRGKVSTRSWKIEAYRTNRKPTLRFRFRSDESSPTQPGPGWRAAAKLAGLNRKHISRSQLLLAPAKQ